MLYLRWCYCPLLILIAWCMCGIDWDEHFRRLFSLTVPPPMKILPHWLKKPSFSIRKERRLVPVSVFHSEMRLLPVALWLSFLHDACDMTNSMMHAWVLAVEVPLTSYHLFLSETSVRWLPCASILIQGKPKKGSCLCGWGLCLEFITILVLFYKKYFWMLLVWYLYMFGWN
jgi:hypothetical protein